jgi:transcriptional regulator with XRE-family HTH domain
MGLSVKPVSSLKSGARASRLAQEIGRRIRAARLQRGLSCRDLAIRLGVAYQQIHKYEIGKDTMPLHRLLELASIWGLPPQAFWDQADAAERSTDIVGGADIDTLQLVRAYQRIGDAKVRRRLLHLVKQIAGEDDESASP